MKQIFSTIKIMIFVGVLTTSFTSCEDFMSTESNRLTLADDNLINSPNDTVYSILGILSKVQKLSDNYVLLGELRGDLMDASVTADIDLRNLSNFTIDPTTSQFSSVRDYYSVINNCNYFISKADTSIVVGNYKPFAKEVVAARSIRAWTYLQVVLNYGKAQYFSNPILTYTETKVDYPELGVEQMIDTLIADLGEFSPTSIVSLPVFGSVDGIDVKKLFINPKLILGDLYLWKASFTKSVADYEMAASYYANLIKDERLIVDNNMGVRWANDYFEITYDSWSSRLTSTGSSEILSLTQMAQNSFEGNTGQIRTLCSENQLEGSSAYYDISLAQTYCLYDNIGKTTKYNPGDLRIQATIRNNLEDVPTIRKFILNNVNFYRVGLVYLRYAEAVNRAGRPGLSFAVLKYGLNFLNLKDTQKVPAADFSDQKEYVTIFNTNEFSSNVGIHNRGCGSSTYNENYVIPDYTRYTDGVITDINGDTLLNIAGTDSIGPLPTTIPALLAEAKMDSLLFVENTICDELALETALEGNRFQDLMRFSNHRDDNGFLATKVAAKHENSVSIYNLLMDKSNWYVPTE